MAAEKRLVVLYGPPASGKLPIAEAISAETDWVLFDNSAAIDFVAQFLPPGTPRFLELVDSLRLDLIRAMLAEGRSVVFTFVYFGLEGEDISFFKFLAAAATSVGASVHLVQLRCSEETLLKRVSNASWHRSWESTTSQNFAQISGHGPLEKSLPSFASLQIDTDGCGPDSAAAMIVECVRKGVLPQRS
jgi:chloramphenicol 3-O-phosphotransferase